MPPSRKGNFTVKYDRLPNGIELKRAKFSMNEYELRSKGETGTKLLCLLNISRVSQWVLQRERKNCWEYLARVLDGVCSDFTEFIKATFGKY